VVGELRVEPVTDDPHRFERLERVFLGAKLAPRGVSGCGVYRGRVTLMLEGVATKEAAAALLGTPLYVLNEEREPRGPGEYYIDDLVGMDVFDEEGRHLGVLAEVWQPGANDVYVVRREGVEAKGRQAKEELLIPAVRDVVLKIDLDGRRMTVRLLPGLGEG